MHKYLGPHHQLNSDSSDVSLIQVEIFWVVIPCIGFSEDHAASVSTLKAAKSSGKSVSNHITTRRQNPEDLACPLNSLLNFRNSVR